jgi:Fe-S oxidoreductase
MKSLLNNFGITPHRNLPQLAVERFSVWFQKQQQPPKTKKVVLFNDTYTEYNEPQIGKSAFKILLELDYEVILAHGYCCGRPLISKGFLKEAKAQAINNIEKLSSIVNEGVKMIVLEPSCASAFRDDYRGLVKNEGLKNLISNTLSLEEFLQEQLIDEKLPLNFTDSIEEIWVHTHCHQKALVGIEPTLNVLKGIKGINVHEIEAGCCGMAGSFGYEKEHYDFSMKIGSLKLFPKIQSLHNQGVILASGMSCRSQIKDGTERKAVHLAEVIANKIS